MIAGTASGIEDADTTGGGCSAMATQASTDSVMPRVGSFSRCRIYVPAEDGLGHDLIQTGHPDTLELSVPSLFSPAAGWRIPSSMGSPEVESNPHTFLAEGKHDIHAHRLGLE